MSFYIHSKKNEANKDLIDISDQLKTYYTSPSNGAFKINNNLNSEAEFLQNTLAKSTSYTDNNNSTGFKIRNKYDITQNINTINNFIESDIPFVFKISIVSEGRLVLNLPSHESGYDFKVDWGDKSEIDSVVVEKSTATSTPIEHPYPLESGIIEYTISISGVFPTVDLLENPYLIEILSFGSSLTSLESSFKDCTFLTKVSSGFSKNLTNCKLMCYGCSGLVEFDTSGLFFVTSVDSAWNECSTLASFNTKGLINTTNADNAWKGCIALETFDAVGLVKLETFDNAWRHNVEYILGDTFLNYKQLIDLEDWDPKKDDGNAATGNPRIAA
jgi:hypothetical protein